jgi:anti-anti-sigma factor
MEVDEVLSIATGVREGFQIVVVRGELDELTAPELERAIDACPPGWPLVIDLGGIEFMSSAGLHVLLRERVRRLTLVRPPEQIARLFEIVDADHHAQIVDDLDAAIFCDVGLAH